MIIYGLYIHHCWAKGPSPVMSPNRKIMQLGKFDGDAIRLVTTSKVWIDHNIRYECQDGLIDVRRGSTDVTISNNWFRNQEKVKLFGHDDEYIRDKTWRSLLWIIILALIGTKDCQGMYLATLSSLIPMWSSYILIYFF